MDYSTDGINNLWLTPIAYLFSPAQRIYIPYLCTSFLVAIWLSVVEDRRERREKTADERGPRISILRRIFPAKVYFHRSAIADYFYFYANTVFYAAINAPALFSFSAISITMYDYLSKIFGEHPRTGFASMPVAVLYSIALVLVFDLALFLAHMIQHLIPFLWNFHKVHHSAEVLTPISVYRMHPIDDMLSFLFTGVFSGVFDGIFRYCFAWRIYPPLILGVNFVLFLFYVGFYHLRHSHLWLSYGPRWSRIFISPAQHQIHHSKARRHWNKNYGFIFAFWDDLFGSLYVPKQREKIDFGIGDGSESEFSNFARLYWVPFRDAFKMLSRRSVSKTPGNGQGEAKDSKHS